MAGKAKASPKARAVKKDAFKLRKIRGLQMYFWRAFSSKSDAHDAALRARKRGDKVRVKMGRGRMKGAYLVYTSSQHPLKGQVRVRA